MNTPEANNRIVTRSKTRTTGEKIEEPLKTHSRRSGDSGGSQMSSTKEKREVRMGDICQVTDGEYCYFGDCPDDSYSSEFDVQIWNGGVGLEDKDVVEYLHYAAHSFRIPGDKALYILHACKNDIERAKIELHGHISLEDEWTSDDDRVFWYAFSSFGKNFAKIKQLLPHKKMGSIVCHYYSTKKEQHYKSLINDDLGKPSYDDLSDDDDVQNDYNSHVFFICKNCGASVKQTHYVNMLEVCRACKLYYKIANEHRPANRPVVFEKRITCPKEMKEIAQQFEAMAKPSERAVEDDEIMCYDKPKRTVCDDLIDETNRQIQEKRAKASILNSSNSAVDYRQMCDVDRASELLERISQKVSQPRLRCSHTWSTLEQAAAFHCLVRFDYDFDAVAEVMGSKTPEMVIKFAREHADLIKKTIEKEALKKEEVQTENLLPQKPVEVLTID